MSGIPNWDKITSPLGSTTTEFGGNWANLISDYYNGVNISLLDASKAPLIGTVTRYKYEKLSLLDVDASHSILFSIDDIDTGPTRKVKFRRMNNPYEEDYAVLEQLSQELFHKIINSDNNTITNIKNADIKAAAGIVTTKLADSANFLLKTLDNSLGAHYFDMTRMTAPSNPATNDGRFFIEQVDSNNEGVFCLIKKAGSFSKVQIL